MDREIINFTKTRLPYGWMGNMSPYPVIWDNKQWRTTEALFQAMRFPPETPFPELIREEKSPMGAKLKAKSNAQWMDVEQLSDKDLANMEICVRLKLEQHVNLVKDLLDTGDAIIYEDVTSRGSGGSNLFWGALKQPNGIWSGRNHLGKIWMKLREELKNNKDL